MDAPPPVIPLDCFALIIDAAGYRSIRGISGACTQLHKMCIMRAYNLSMLELKDYTIPLPNGTTCVRTCYPNGYTIKSIIEAGSGSRAGGIFEAYYIDGKPTFWTKNPRRQDAMGHFDPRYPTIEGPLCHENKFVGFSMMYEGGGMISVTLPRRDGRATITGQPLIGTVKYTECNRSRTTTVRFPLDNEWEDHFPTPSEIYAWCETKLDKYVDADGYDERYHATKNAKPVSWFSVTKIMPHHLYDKWAPDPDRHDPVW